MLKNFIRYVKNMLNVKKSPAEKKTLGNYQGSPYQSDLRIYTPQFYGGTIQNITGYTEEDFRKGVITWDEVVHPEDLHLFLQEDERLKNNEGYMFNLEYRIIHRDGRIRWVRDIGQVLPTPDEKYPQISGSIYDITEEKGKVENMRRALGISREDLYEDDYKKK